MGQFADFLDNVEMCLSTKGSVATKQCGEAFGAFCDMIKNAASRNLVPGATMPSKPSLAKPGRDYVEIRRMETGFEVPITEPTSCARLHRLRRSTREQTASTAKRTRSRQNCARGESRAARTEPGAPITQGPAPQRRHAERHRHFA